MATLNKDIENIKEGSTLAHLYKKLVAGMEESSKETLPDFTGPDYQIDGKPDENKINKAVLDFSSIMRKNTAYMLASVMSESGGAGFLPMSGGNMEGKLKALYGFEAGDDGKAYIQCFQKKSLTELPRNITRILSELHVDSGKLFMKDKDILNYEDGILTINASHIVFNGKVHGIGGGGDGSGSGEGSDLLLVKDIKSLNYRKGIRGFAILTDYDGSGSMEAGRLNIRNTAVFGKYRRGTSGASIRENGDAEFESVTARSSVITPVLSSQSFVSGFPNGQGYQLSTYDRVNTAGVTETRYRLEIDDLVVRGVFRVFELIVSQLRGENDNVIFAGMMKVVSIDPDKRIIYLDTDGGVLYNTFRPDDILMVQRFQGLSPGEEHDYEVVKQYELTVVDAFIGNTKDGKNRTDYITYKNFVGNINSVEAGDTLTRVDNLTNPLRKGIIKITTIDDFGSPYMDVVYGMKTDPDNCTKVRLGNLEGITTPYWGRLQGYGLMATNVYLKGKFMLHNGKDIEQIFEVADGKLNSTISSVRTEMNAKDNYLSNASFADNLDKWEAGSDISVYTVDEKFLEINKNFYTDKRNIAAVVTDGAYRLLRLRRSSITQLNENLANNKVEQIIKYGEPNPETGETTETKEWPDFYVSFKYKCTEKGTLTLGFAGKPLSHMVDINPNDDFEEVEYSGKWDGTGDFLLQFSGDISIMSLVMTNRPLEDFKVSYKTKIIQTDKKIELNASAISKNKAELAKLVVKADQISAEVTENKNGIEAAKQQLKTLDEAVKGFTSVNKYEQAANPWYEWKENEQWKHIGDVWHKNSEAVPADTKYIVNHTYRYYGYNNAVDEWEDITEIAGNAAFLKVNKDSIVGAVANFNPDGSIKNGSAIFTTAYGTTLISKATDEMGRNIESKFQTEAGKIQASIEAQDGRISLLEQTVDGFKTTVQGSIDSQNTTISTLEQTASQFQTTIKNKVDGQDTQISTIKQTVDSIKLSVGTSEKAAKDAKDAAIQAATDAQNAVSAESGANAAKQAAINAKNAAQGYANDAYSSEYYAQQYKDRAESAATSIVQTKDFISLIRTSFTESGKMKSSSVVIGDNVTALSTKLGELEASISAAIVMGDDGHLKSNIKIKASDIIFEGNTNINNSFIVDADQTVHLGPFKVTSSGLECSNFDTKVHIFMGDENKDACLIGYDSSKESVFHVLTTSYSAGIKVTASNNGRRAIFCQAIGDATALYATADPKNVSSKAIEAYGDSSFGGDLSVTGEITGKLAALQINYQEVPGNTYVNVDCNSGFVLCNSRHKQDITLNFRQYPIKPGSVVFVRRNSEQGKVTCNGYITTSTGGSSCDLTDSRVVPCVQDSSGRWHV